MLNKILMNLNRTDGIVGSLVCGNDGLLIQAVMEPGTEKSVSEEFASIVSSIFSSWDSLYSGAKNKNFEILEDFGNIKRAMIETTEGGTIIINRVNENALLAVIVESGANLGLIRMNMDDILSDIASSI